VTYQITYKIHTESRLHACVKFLVAAIYPTLLGFSIPAHAIQPPVVAPTGCRQPYNVYQLMPPDAAMCLLGAPSPRLPFVERYFQNLGKEVMYNKKRTYDSLSMTNKQVFTKCQASSYDSPLFEEGMALKSPLQHQ
jgi:hypothetical protein